MPPQVAGVSLRVWAGRIVILAVLLLLVGVISLQVQFLHHQDRRRESQLFHHEDEPRERHGEDASEGKLDPTRQITTALASQDGGHEDRGPVERSRESLARWIREAATLEEVDVFNALKGSIAQAPWRMADMITNLTSQRWQTCAKESEYCHCFTGSIRFGHPDKEWLTHKTSPWAPVKCAVSARGPFKRDPAQRMVKECQCDTHEHAQCPDGRPPDLRRCPGQFCKAACSRGSMMHKTGQAHKTPVARASLCADRVAYELLWSCNRGRSRGRPAPGHRHSEAQQMLDKATEELCADAELAAQLETYLDCEFHESYMRWTSDTSEWLEEAYVTYVGGAPNSHFQWIVTSLIRSVQHFSSRPIVLVVVDDIFVPPISWHQYPNLLVYRMRPRIEGQPFNFNKIRAMIGARVVTGVELDADQFIVGQLDRLFAPTRREVGPMYPFPILPVHMFTRDASACTTECRFNFVDFDGPWRMRWCHAHPSWTYWALPFYADLLLVRLLVLRAKLGRTKLEPSTPLTAMTWKLSDLGPSGARALLTGEARRVASDPITYKVWMKSDEPMLNAWLWLAHASKAWCKWDVDFTLWKTRTPSIQKTLYHDRKWYLDGLPIMYYAAHGLRNVETSDTMLSAILRCSERERQGRTPPRKCEPAPKQRNPRLSEEHWESYLNQWCCNLAPRLSRPIHWYGVWYNDSSEVPEVSLGPAKAPRLCLVA